MKPTHVAELKQLVKKPEVVEWTDVTAADPAFSFTSSHTVTPFLYQRTGRQRRDYLRKRGIEKPPFQLPSYIADTELRQ